MTLQQLLSLLRRYNKSIVITPCTEDFEVKLGETTITAKAEDVEQCIYLAMAELPKD